MTLATKTGEVKFLQRGKRGMLPYPAGEYDLHTSYVCTDMLAPYVLYNGIYYVMNQVTTWVGQGMPSNINNPQKDYAVNGTKATWIPFENYKAIYVELLMANFAKLASAVFYGDYMFSQQGVDADGNLTSNYKGFGSNDFTPNILLDFKTGYAKLINADIVGILRAKAVYTSFQRLIFESGYVLNPLKDGLNILTQGNGFTPTLVLPSPADWDGVQLTIYIPTPSTRLNTAIYIKNNNGYFEYNKRVYDEKYNRFLCYVGYTRLQSVDGNWYIESVTKDDLSKV